ncbi:putative bifunctional diguanylate cyclase/phosphodiesterase [Cupriavidus sp. IDO]|uniref:putative bifunctional diguanylate cyclase/phosphodiesterase n=1 Tax=Cupriavidus sp. IDO TaxID=1539142 RepID=UPI0006899AAB|nr:EAL domain-containing protein [Cupriavidus sp. IDO]KWR90498.1 diguanylate phosphodiesterase [Cupriavidus sp. IDO]
MNGTYNPLLVFLSLIVASLASYTALELASRIFQLSSRWQQMPWLVGGAVVMGIGIWSMHFIGMMAFSLPVPLGYDLATTAISMLIASVVSFLALALVTRGHLSAMRIAVGGTLMGLGIAAMHYVGMAAMEMSPPVRYSAWIVATSVGIAIAASSAALWIAFTLRGASDEQHIVPKRLGSALVMGLAITGMHYTGMSAADFAPGSVCLSVNKLDPNWLAMIVSAASLVLLTGTLLFLGWHASSLANSLRRANHRLQHLGTHDALTNLPNRLLLAGQVGEAIRTFRRGEGVFAVLFVDLDGFKTINDSLGHAVGDELLKTCAERLNASVRRNDVVARVGGDEFVILLRDLSEAANAATVAASLLRMLCQEAILHGVRLRVSASIGIALYPRDGTDTEALLHSADAAMYDAKQGGRNTYRFFEPGMHANAIRTLTLQRDLQRALEEGHLSIVFQPKFCMGRQALTGAEALIRWHHPEIGDIPPLEFIPIAERSGQIIQIGEWVIREVCRWIAQWESQGLPRVQISINLSPVQFNVPDLVERIDAIVRAAGVEPAHMMFEITESVAMQNAEKSAETIRRFHASGYEMAIDDFGTGYSSLAYLQRFQVRQIKVDRYFTQELDLHEAEGEALLSAIVTLSHALHMNVIAEGVETDTQMSKLAALGCDEVQGFLLARPLAGAVFEDFLRGGAEARVDRAALAVLPASTSGEAFIYSAAAT